MVLGSEFCKKEKGLCSATHRFQAAIPNTVRHDAGCSCQVYQRIETPEAVSGHGEQPNADDTKPTNGGTRIDVGHSKTQE